MNFQESKELVKFLAGRYQAYYKKKSDEDLKADISYFATTFKNTDYRMVMTAARYWTERPVEGNQYPPTPPKLVEVIAKYLLATNADKESMKAWNELDRYFRLCTGSYAEDLESYSRLPDVIRDLYSFEDLKQLQRQYENNAAICMNMVVKKIAERETIHINQMIINGTVPLIESKAAPKAAKKSGDDVLTDPLADKGKPSLYDTGYLFVWIEPDEGPEPKKKN